MSERFKRGLIDSLALIDLYKAAEEEEEWMSYQPPAEPGPKNGPVEVQAAGVVGLG